jgi:hypothetical protein
MNTYIKILGICLIIAIILLSGNSYKNRQVELYEQGLKSQYEKKERELLNQLSISNQQKDSINSVITRLNSDYENLVRLDSIKSEQLKVKGRFKNLSAVELENLMNSEYARQTN